MLDFMRRHAQSWMIKVALGAVVVVFIFWGIWNPREGRERDLVKIGDQTITITEARNYYQNLRERFQSIYGERFTEEMDKKLGLKERAVKDLIHKVLLLQEAKRLGLRVMPEELQSSIQNHPAFQKEGAFDQATYLRALQRARMTPKEFESSQKQMLLITRVQNLIASSAKISDREILEAYQNTFEKVNLDVLSFSPSDIQDISSTPEELKTYFAKHREEFKIPAKANARYLLFNPKEYSKQVQVTPAEIDNFYQNNREKFGQPKRVKVRHILIKSDPKDAEEAAFSLKVGGISNVIQTPYGLHILKVDEIQEARTEPLEKVREQTQELLRNRKARELAHDEADQAFAAASKEKKLDGFAKEKNLALKETGLFSAGDKRGLDPKLKDSALSLSKGDVSPVLRLGETFAVLQVTEKQEARVPELKEAAGQ